MLLAPAAARAEVLSVRHELEVRLDLQARMLKGRDIISVQVDGSTEIPLGFGPNVRVLGLELDGGPGKYTVRDGLVRVSLPADRRRGVVRLTVQYEGVFADPWPEDPHVFDNPGYGVAATITDFGAFFLAGSGWYPRIEARERGFMLTVRAPKGIYAVTSGTRIGHGDPGDESVSKWISAAPSEEIALFAGPYVLGSRRAGNVPVYTYFYPDNAGLSPVYLDAASRHVLDFSTLHGPYAFPKFAVVENFFPTGYGFPSYTLLGSQVLRLPFIPETSLRHEVAHCWWGNGVLVDHRGGNWSEGLTTYVADYLAKERASAQEAAEYRRQILRDYTQLAAGKQDMPLRRFVSRQDPATRAVGYGKAMFVFHMARRIVEDRPFWAALRDVYAKRLFLPTGWDHFRQAFVDRGWDLDEAEIFFQQWLDRPGAPRLRLGETESRRLGSRWIVRGELVQDEPHYSLRVPVRVRTATLGETRLIPIDGPSASFSFTLSESPLSLDVDPDAHVFRLLAPEELPVTVNSLKASNNLIAVMAESLDEISPGVARIFLDSLGQGGADLLREQDIDAADLAGRDVLFFGFPATTEGRRAVASVQSGKWSSLDQLSQRDTLALARSDTQFAVYADPERSGRVVAFFVPKPSVDMGSAEEAARKITHYGKYSYLGFESGANTVKGVWEPRESPLSIDFEEE